ncbi:MAG TPA: alpha-1-antitrypsin, partial [Dehalococcoidia bacterium]|nr:alpha-1-antitrypsin [Dehalococcoidia bacterium]
MAFLSPLFLVGLIGVAIPILVHLIRREQNQVIPFPSLMFLRRIPYQAVRQRRSIRNLILLLVRLTAFVLIVIAFARPFFTGSASVM